MKKVILGAVLGGLLLMVAGCGGGGGGSSSGGDEVSSIVSYQVTNSIGDTITMKVTKIEILSNLSLKVYCQWTGVNNSGSAKFAKVSDKEKMSPIEETRTCIYLKDNNGKTYNHTGGEGAAYAHESNLSATPVKGAYYFPKLDSGVTNIYFCDDDWSKELGPITISSN